jgi:hypothetical protein
MITIEKVGSPENRQKLRDGYFEKGLKKLHNRAGII